MLLMLSIIQKVKLVLRFSIGTYCFTPESIYLFVLYFKPFVPEFLGIMFKKLGANPHFSKQMSEQKKNSEKLN